MTDEEFTTTQEKYASGEDLTGAERAAFVEAIEEMYRHLPDFFDS